MENSKKRQNKKIRALFLIEQIKIMIEQTPNDDALGARLRLIMKKWEEK
jgi:hypothetical protein